jgi:hypothetical protein
MRYLSSISLALIVLMALACTATPATPAPTPLPTPDVPLLDEETVNGLVLAYVTGQSHLCGELYLESISLGRNHPLETQYVGRDIWVVNMGVSMCTHTVHDKKAHVILPQQDKTAD